MKKFIAMMLCLSILFCSFAFADGYKLKLSPTNLTLKVGETANVAYSVTPKNLMEHTVKWESENAYIASVSASGKITARAAGSTHIIATLESGETARVTVNVSGKAVTNLVIVDSDIELEVGQSATFEYIMNEDADDKRVRWSSDDESVAKIDQSGRVTAVGGGIATITLLAVNGRTATASVYVPSEVRTVKLYPDKVEVGVGGELALDAYIFPGNARNRELTWASSDESVATVDENGVVTGVAPGDCMIRATTLNGVNAFSSIRVAHLPDGILLSPATVVLSKEKRNASLSVTVSPEKARDCTLIWASSDETVVKVSSSGALTATGFGTATVTATAANGVSGEAEVFVCEPPNAIYLDATRYSVSADGEQVTVRYTFSPIDSYETGVTFSVGNPKIASIDENGVLTGMSYGTTTVTATSPSGLTAKADVLVYENADAIYVNESALTLEQYEFYKLNVYAGNGKLFITELAGKSDNPDVCVWSDGSIFAKNPGKAHITLSNPGTSLTCQVTVTVVECFTKPSKIIALTFDNGPGKYTQDVLSVLDQYGVSATFFLLGENVEADRETAILYKNTSHELGNHTYDNSGVASQSIAELSQALEMTDKLITDAAGRKATLLRAPDARLPKALFTSFVDSRRFVGRGEIMIDTSEETDADALYGDALSRCYNNAVLTFHEVSPATAKTLNKLIPALLKQGYRFVTVSELMTETRSIQSVFSTKR